MKIHLVCTYDDWKIRKSVLLRGIFLSENKAQEAKLKLIENKVADTENIVIHEFVNGEFAANGGFLLGGI